MTRRFDQMSTVVTTKNVPNNEKGPYSRTRRIQRIERRQTQSYERIVVPSTYRALVV